MEQECAEAQRKNLKFDLKFGLFSFTSESITPLRLSVLLFYLPFQTVSESLARKNKGDYRPSVLYRRRSSILWSVASGL